MCLEQALKNVKYTTSAYALNDRLKFIVRMVFV